MLSTDHHRKQAEWWTYALALVSVTIVLLLTSFNEGPFAELNERVLLLAVVMLTSWVGGWKPGLLAILLSVVGYYYFPAGQTTLGLGQSLRFIEFVFVALLIIFLNERRRASQHQAEVARKEAEAANHTKDEFLAAVSHDLRTPLTAVLGWAEVLSITYGDPGLRARGLNAIINSARKQSLLIEDLLDMSRVSTGHLRIERKEMELASVIEAAIETLKPAIETKRMQLRTQYDTRKIVVMGDERRMQQVIWNLISNAIKFTSEGGLITVRLEYEKSHAQIVVKDNGRGITANFLPHVFERFQQADTLGTAREGGLGLGLAISRHLVELHGGTIKVSSKGEEQGAEFIVKLPAPQPCDQLPKDLPNHLKVTEDSDTGSNARTPLEVTPSIPIAIDQEIVNVQ